MGGAATSAVKLATARTISLTGSVTGSGSFDGSGNLSITTSGVGTIFGTNSEIFNDYTNNKVASNAYAHAEGRFTQALGHSSHAEGNTTIASGSSSHAEGDSTTASGAYAHAEGVFTVAGGDFGAHAEGNGTTSIGESTHAEGSNTYSIGSSTHSECGSTIAAGHSAHAEGWKTAAIGSPLVEKVKDSEWISYTYTDDNNIRMYFIEGYGVWNLFDQALNAGNYLYFVGRVNAKLEVAKVQIVSVDIIDENDLSYVLKLVYATNSSVVKSTPLFVAVEAVDSYNGAHSEGYDTLAFNSAHAEGYRTTAYGETSHAEGAATTASGGYSHAQGYATTASGSSSHAEGFWSVAAVNCAHAEGYYTSALGARSHAEGDRTVASGMGSHVQGYYTTGETYLIDVIGRYNKVNSGTSGAYTASNNAFVIGNGSSSSNKSNAFRVTFAGAAYGLSAFNSTGADYSEYFEWEDGNLNNEDRIGKFVTLVGEKIKIAQESDYILGVVSGQAAIIGNASDDNWNEMYLRDKYGRLQYEEIAIEAEYETIPAITKTETNDNGETITTVVSPETQMCIREAGTEVILKVNPNYDPELEYVPRSERKEWDTIGMLGQLIVDDDGTCEVNGFCKCNASGIATTSDSGYRVLRRIDETTILILFK